MPDALGAAYVEMPDFDGPADVPRLVAPRRRSSATTSTPPARGGPASCPAPDCRLSRPEHHAHPPRHRPRHRRRASPSSCRSPRRGTSSSCRGSSAGTTSTATASQKAFDVALHIGTLVAVVPTSATTSSSTSGRAGGRCAARAGASRPRAASPGCCCWRRCRPPLVGALVREHHRRAARHASRSSPCRCIVFGLLLGWADTLPAKRDIDDIGPQGRRSSSAPPRCCRSNPGTSRSGITITAGRMRTFTRESAARISFLMAIPVTAGAVVFKVGKLVKDGIPDGLAVPMIVGHHHVGRGRLAGRRRAPQASAHALVHAVRDLPGGPRRRRCSPWPSAACAEPTRVRSDRAFRWIATDSVHEIGSGAQDHDGAGRRRRPGPPRVRRPR